MVVLFWTTEFGKKTVAEIQNSLN